jgi:hypothetical protein
MLELELFVKPKLSPSFAKSPKLTIARPIQICTTVPVRPVQMAS